MRLVEQHVIARGDPRYGQIDAAAFASKNLWNAANYLVRQAFIHEGRYLNNTAVYHQIKGHAAYQALPRKVSNQVLLQLHQALAAVIALGRKFIAQAAVDALPGGEHLRALDFAGEAPLRVENLAGGDLHAKVAGLQPEPAQPGDQLLLGDDAGAAARQFAPHPLVNIDVPARPPQQ